MEMNNYLYKIKIIGLCIFLIAFLSVNLCLVLSQIFPFKEFDVPSPGNYFYQYKIFNIGDAIGEKGSQWIIPYFDGISSISRVVRVFPNYLIFKPAMIIVGILLIYFWFYLKKLFINFGIEKKIAKRIFLLSRLSAFFLIIHSVFLGIKFDYEIIKLLKRVILLLFVILQIATQYYFIKIINLNLGILKKIIRPKIFLIKKIIVYSIIIIAISILPFLPFNNFKILKHLIEWNYFLCIILFYFFTYFLWKNNVKIN